MSFMAQQELNGRSSGFHDRKASGSSDEGALTSFGRMALHSLRGGELPGLDAFLSSKDADSAESCDDMSSRDPDSPLQQGKEFDNPTIDPRDVARDPRDGRRKVGFMSRLVHR
jgi:hypothetical protein